MEGVGSASSPADQAKADWACQVQPATQDAGGISFRQERLWLHPTCTDYEWNCSRDDHVAATSFDMSKVSWLSQLRPGYRRAI